MADEVKYKVADDFSASVKLFSGADVKIDITKIGIGEWKKALKPETSDEEEYKIIAKVTGLKVADIEKMSQPDYRMIIDSFVRLGTQPLTNPT